MKYGLVTIVGLALTAFAYKKVGNKYKKFYVFSLVMGLISLVMTLKIFPFEKLPSILKMLQFSFRMLEFSSFFFAIVVGINLSIVIKDFKMKDVIVLTIIVGLLLIPMIIQNIPYTDKVREENSLWPAVRVNEKTGRVHAGCASFEYLPSRAFEHLDYIKTREDKTYILNGKANITYQEKNGTNMFLTIEEAENNTILELPYIYYSGYEVIMKTNSEKIKLPVTESENGFIQVKLENGMQRADITVKYRGTGIMKASRVISILGFSILILYVCWRKKQNI